MYAIRSYYVNASFNVANNSNRDFSILDIWFSYGNTPTQNKYLRNVNDVKFPIIIEKRKVTNFEEYKDNILPIDELYKNGELVDFEYRLLLKKHFSEYVAQFTSNSSKLIRKSLDNKNLKYIKIYINLQVLKQNGKTVVIRIPYDNLVICKDIDEANQGYVPSFMENQYKPRNSRITSYNVCYTKLLRIIILSIDIRKGLFSYLVIIISDVIINYWFVISHYSFLDLINLFQLSQLGFLIFLLTTFPYVLKEVRRMQLTTAST